MWNASSDFDYYDEIGQSEQVREDESSPCGCGRSGCRIDGNDASNVNVHGKWYASDCTGLCYFCGCVDDLRNLDRIAGSWLAHGVCASRDQQLLRASEASRRSDEDRDDMNGVRR